jgi:hypothetical protein
MLVVIVLLLASWPHVVGAVEVDCQTLLDGNSGSLKKTKAWKTCQKYDNEVLQCQRKGYKVGIKL